MTRPTAGLSLPERRVFWRVYAVCSQIVSAEVDVEEHARNVARAVVARRAVSQRRLAS